MQYRWNVSSLSIDISADNRTTTISRHIDRHSTNQYNRYVSQYIKHHMGHFSGQYIVMDRYVDQGVHKLGKIQKLSVSQ